MKRRDFIKSSVIAGLFSGAAISISALNKSLAISPENNTPEQAFDLAAVKGGEPEVMFDKGIEALGGMKRFVKSGQKVVIKPNIGWDAPLGRGSNTHPKLVKRIVEHCKQAGAKEILVFDHTCDDWKTCYAVSGIEEAVKAAGGKMVPGNIESFYKEVEIPMGKRLRKDKIHEAIINADVFINVPVLKDHAAAKLTISMKNLMGVNWDRPWWHKNDLNQCIADFATYVKPTLNVVDAYFVMKQNGPKGVSTDDVVTMKTLIISTDIVAADAAAAKTFGLEPESIAYIKKAHEMKIGNMNLDELKISRIKI